MRNGKKKRRPNNRKKRREEQGCLTNEDTSAYFDARHMA